MIISFVKNCEEKGGTYFLFRAEIIICCYRDALWVHSQRSRWEKCAAVFWKAMEDYKDSL